jgi:hypothetical protein
VAVEVEIGKFYVEALELLMKIVVEPVGKGRQFRQSRRNSPGWSVPVLDEARLVDLINSGLRAQHAATAVDRSRSKSPRPSTQHVPAAVDPSRGRKQFCKRTPTARSTSRHSERCGENHVSLQRFLSQE